MGFSSCVAFSVGREEVSGARRTKLRGLELC